MSDRTDDAFRDIVSMYDNKVPAVVPPCPSWCVNPYCARGLDYFDYTYDGLAMRVHLAYDGEMDVEVSVVEQHHADGSYSLEAPEIMYTDCCTPKGSLFVTPKEARILSAELLKATDVVERITTPDMRRPASVLNNSGQAADLSGYEPRNA